MAGTVLRPSIWTVRKYTPVVAATERSWSSSGRPARGERPPAVGRVQRVAEVPAVEGGWETSVAEAGAEGERGQTTPMASTAPVMTDRTGTAVRPRPGSRANRSPATPRHRQPGTQPGPDRARPAARRLPAGGRAVRRQAVADDDGHRAQDDDQDQHAEAEHRRVQVDPGRGLGGRTGPNSENGDRPTATATGEQRPGSDGAEDAKQPVGGGRRGPAPSAAQDLGVIGTGLQLPGDRLERRSSARRARRSARTPPARWPPGGSRRCASASMSAVL